MRTDVAIIGDGAIGVAVAYFLSHVDPSVGVVVVERARLGFPRRRPIPPDGQVQLVRACPLSVWISCAL